MFRALFFLSASLIISVSIVLVFISSHNRFEMIQIDKNLFIFDRKNYSLTVCDSNTCKVIPFFEDQQQIVFPTTVNSIPEVKEVVPKENVKEQQKNPKSSDDLNKVNKEDMESNDNNN